MARGVKSDLKPKKIKPVVESYLGVDWNHYPLGVGLEDIFDSEDFIVNACRRYRDGDIEWKVLRVFLSTLPYFDSEIDPNKFARPKTDFGFEIVVDPELKIENVESARAQGLISDEEYENILSERHKVLRRLYKNRRVPQQGFEKYVGPNGKDICMARDYAGWEVGDYLLWPGTKDLMTELEREEFFRQENQFLESIKADRNKPTSSTFHGVDGKTHKLPDSLVGVMETESPVVEAAKRYHEGSASWDELEFFVVRYDFYSPVHKEIVYLTRDGNVGWTDEIWSFSKRSPEDIQTANNKKYISEAQKSALFDAMDDFESTCDVTFKGMPYGTRS